MRQRLISAAVLVPVVVALFVLGDIWLRLGITAFAVIAAWEASRLARGAGLPAMSWMAVTAPILAALAFETIFVSGGVEYGWILIPSGLALWLMAAAIAALLRHDPAEGLRAWAGTVLAGFYASLLTLAIGISNLQTTVALGGNTFQNHNIGRDWLLILVLTVWALDSAAYAVGKYLPRGHFFNHISPNKTWSGAIGGTLAAVVVCAALAAYLHAFDPLWGAALGLAIAIAAQAGDLTESMFKRAAGAKDSSNLIPGHGGILDRVDSFLFAAPMMYSAFIWVGYAHAGGLLR
jgi:phosphatidate cytidylyltransferase